jgi:hypothetical protein
MVTKRAAKREQVDVVAPAWIAAGGPAAAAAAVIKPAGGCLWMVRDLRCGWQPTACHVAAVGALPESIAPSSATRPATLVTTLFRDSYAPTTVLL